MKREYRLVAAAEVRAKAKDGDAPPAIEGYAAVFDQASEDLGWFREIIKPGAFKRTLKDGADVRCLMNHDQNQVLGRTKNGTLDVSEDAKGLKFRCELPDTQTGRDLHALVSRGDIDQCSFGFMVRSQNWIETKNADGTFDVTRELTDVDLFDIGPVTFPAYPQTSVNARSFRWPDGVPVEVRAHAAKRNMNCECECPECGDGDCEECSDPDCDDPNCEGHIRSGQPQASRSDGVPMKRVDGEDLTADCFLITSQRHWHLEESCNDDKCTSSWKLPWKFTTEEKTKHHLRDALVRLNQLRGVSPSDKDKVWKTIVPLCRQYDIDVSDESSGLRRHLTPEQLHELEGPKQQELNSLRAWAKARAIAAAS